MLFCVRISTVFWRESFGGMVMNRLEKRMDDNIQCEKVFEFLNPNSNDMISKMSESDLKQFITLLNRYYLVLRDKLGFSDDISFGLEIEFENASRYHIDHELYTNMRGSGYVTVCDDSLDDGGEISTPVLYNRVETWKTVSDVCGIVSKWAEIGKNSGGHIHVGAHILGNDSQSWLNFMRLWSVYEYIIYRFANGEFLTSRPSMEEYASPIARCMWLDAKKLEKKNLSLSMLLDYLSSYYGNDAVEFEHVKKHNSGEFRNGNTIEFRCPNGTLDPVIWQNNLNLFVNMLLYAKSREYDINIINKRHENSLERYFSTDMFKLVLQDTLRCFRISVIKRNIPAFLELATPILIF